MGVLIAVNWRGRSGARMHQLPDLLRDLHTAHLIVFHKGTSDLVQLNFFAIQKTLAFLLTECKVMFPYNRLG